MARNCLLLFNLCFNPRVNQTTTRSRARHISGKARSTSSTSLVMHQKMFSFDKLIALFAERIGFVGIHEYFSDVQA